MSTVYYGNCCLFFLVYYLEYNKRRMRRIIKVLFGVVIIDCTFLKSIIHLREEGNGIMLNLIKVLLFEPQKLNITLRMKEPTYRKIFFLLAFISMLPLVFDGWLLLKQFGTDLRQLETAVPAFELNDDSELTLLDGEKPFVFYSDTFVLTVTDQSKPPVTHSSSGLLTVNMTRHHMQIAGMDTTMLLDYQEISPLNTEVLQQFIKTTVQLRYVYFFFYMAILYLFSCLMMLVIQWFYRILVMIVATSMGIMIAPNAFRRLTSVLSIMPVCVMAILESTHFSTSSSVFIGAALILYLTYRTFKITKRNVS